MSTVPTFQVYTKRKLDEDPKKRPSKRYKRLGYRQFRESELSQLDEVLNEANLDLKGKNASFEYFYCLSVGVKPKLINTNIYNCKDCLNLNYIHQEFKLY